MTLSTHRRVRRGAGALLAGLLLAGIGCGGRSAPATGLTKLTFLFPVLSVTQYHAFYLARDLGYFAEEGLDVQFEMASGSSAAIQQLLAGNADAALPSPGAVLNAVARGQDLKWVFSYQYANIFTLVSPTGSGVSSISDLTRRKIGVSELSGGEVPLVRALLRDAGLTADAAVQIVPIGEGGALTARALETHQVDAYASNLFDVAALKASGLAVDVIMPADAQAFPSNGIVVTARTLDEKRPQIAGLVRAVARAVAFVRANDRAAFDMARKIAPEEFEHDALAEAAWDAARTLRTPPASMEGLPIGAHARAAFQAYHDLLVRGTEDEGALPHPVDLDRVLDSSLLSQSDARSGDRPVSATVPQ